MPEKKKNFVQTKKQFETKKMTIPSRNEKTVNMFRVYAIVGGLIFFFSLFFFIRAFFFSSKQIQHNGQDGNVQGNEEMGDSSKPCLVRSGFDGECLDGNQKEFSQIIGVMIENHNQAQPLSGIAQASVIYEAPVEGNIPRFLALYESTDRVSQVGPVRSARPYYVDWISEYGNAMYMHVGGSDEALKNIKKFEIFDMNEFYRGPYFFRLGERSAPHNIYTSSELWLKAFEKFGTEKEKKSYDVWKFGESEICDTQKQMDCEDSLSFVYVKDAYEVTWKYNVEKNLYERYQNGVLHKDADGETITANTVIIQHADMDILDDVGRRKIDTVGDGPAEVYAFGKKVSGKWKKDERASRTQWILDTGEKIPLAPGKIWVELVPTGIVVSN